MEFKCGNIHSNIPKHSEGELFSVLGENKNCRIERIVSYAHKSPTDFWYDQKTDEWVLILEGEAALEFEGEEEFYRMKAGDYILIPAGKKHRVASTARNEPTVWLAIHF